MVEDFQDNLEEIEKLVLLVLGKAGQMISVLHLQKLVFLLWRFHPIIRELVEFRPHKKGPYSKDIQEVLKSPFYYPDHWKYIPPHSSVDRTVGGYVELTDKGRRKYREFSETLESIVRNRNHENRESVLNLLTALDIIVPIHTRLEWDELLLLIYTTEKFKEYSKKSEISKDIKERYQDIMGRLIRKGFLHESKRNLFVKRVEAATWI